MGNHEPRKQIDQTLRVIRDFAVLQKEHRQLAAAGRLGESGEWETVRQTAFIRLQAVLDQLVSLPPNDDLAPQESETIRRAVGRLLDEEEKLAQAIAGQRDTLEKQLAALRSGKKTLRGYGRIQPGSFSPRFLSSRT